MVLFCRNLFFVFVVARGPHLQCCEEGDYVSPCLVFEF